MKRFFPSLAFASIAALASLGDAAAQTAGNATVVVTPGHCAYSDSLAPLLEQDHDFILCDRMEISRGAGPDQIKFAFPARLRSVEFRGGFSGAGVFQINAIRLRSRPDWEETEGQCEFVPAGSDYSQVKCIVRNATRFIVVNFAPRR